jgi:hypothetical protein
MASARSRFLGLGAQNIRVASALGLPFFVFCLSRFFGSDTFRSTPFAQAPFAQDGMFLVGACRDGTIKSWDLSTK